MLYKLYLLLKTTSIISLECFKSLFCDGNDKCIINICEKLSSINMFYVKMFQAISSDNNVLSTDVQQYLSNFTDHVPYGDKDIDTSYFDVLRKYKYKLGCITPINSGVMSLVYEIYNENDEKFIMKVKRKNIDHRLQESIEEMRFIIDTISLLPYVSSMNLKDVFAENIESFIEQLDFNKEVCNMIYFQEKNKNLDYIETPNVLREITNYNKNIIVMSFIEGKKLNEVDNSEKDKYCELLAKFGVKCVFFDGVYHGDLHQGNLLFMKKGDEYVIGVLDFGVIGKITREEQNKFYGFMQQFYNSHFNDAAKLFLENHVGPNKNLERLSEENKNKIIQEIATILERIITVTKHATPNDLYTISNILHGYDLRILKYFCKVQLAFMINETVCRNLSVNRSFIEYYGELLTSDYF